MEKPNYFLLICLGIVTGLILYLSPTTIFMALIVFIIVLILSSFKLPLKEKRFILTIFISGILVRFLICILIYFISVSSGGSGSLFDDDVYRPRAAWLFYQSWLGNFDITAYDKIGVATGGVPLRYEEFYFVLISLLSSVIRDYTPLLAKFINVILGSLIPLIIYSTFKGYIKDKAIRLATVFITFFPSLILWSVLALKDTFNLFLVVVNIFLYSKLLQRKSVKFFIFFIVSLFATYFIRKESSLVLFFVFLISIFIQFKISLFKKLIIVCICILCSFIVAPLIFKEPLIDILARYGVVNLLGRHVASVNSGGNTYEFLDKQFYAPPYLSINFGFFQAIKAITKGSIYFMFIPFLWSARNFWQIASIPQMMIWYSLFPFFSIGIFYIIKKGLKELIPVLLFFIIMFFGMALSEGNIGTAVRHRDILSPFYLLISVIGIFR